MITYCTNIHPGESWDEIFLNLKTHFLTVKEAVSPNEPFPIGLRLSDRAAMEIGEKASNEFYEWCQENGCFVPTINGFSYGSFHSIPIKENVYLPDWRNKERVEYTKRLVDLLFQWLPKGVKGSISTVPIGFKKHVNPSLPSFTKRDMGGLDIVRQNLIDVLEHIDRLKQKSGKEIILSLEPEPGCVIETTEDVVRFFEQMSFPKGLRDGIGICYDCCHQAAEFENPIESLALLSMAKIKIGKVQVSSALRLNNFDRKILERLAEPCYLHQVVIEHQDGNLTRYNDIPDALRAHQRNTGEEWRIHFHVPIFIDNMATYGTTRVFIEEILPLLDRHILLEVETYTWHILPPELQTEKVTHSIIHEIQWVKSQRDETNCCS